MAGNPGGVGPPPVPGSHLTMLEWPIAKAPPGDTCPDQPNMDKDMGKEEVNTSSSLNDGHLQTRTSTEQASYSSAPRLVPYNSPTLDPGENTDEIVTFSTACTPCFYRKHSYANEAPDPQPDHTYKKRRILVKKNMKIKKKQRDSNQPQFVAAKGTRTKGED